MADEDVEMKSRSIAQARLPADNAWASDHPVELGVLVSVFVPTIISQWTFDLLNNRKHVLPRVTRTGRSGGGGLDRYPGIWWV